MELLPGSDGSVRAARVEVISDGGGKKVLNRSLKHLIPLEVRCSSLQLSKVPQEAQATAQEQPIAKPVARVAQDNIRNRRDAAAIGELRRREQKF